MPIKLNPPWIGIAVPTFLIGFIGYSSHYFILSNFASKGQQWSFQFTLIMTWISYIMAIYTKPGNPPDEFTPGPRQWKNFCKKCKNFKPERTHHCKSCKQCVLVMDHHCPWTMNCVGYQNFPHFMRFLIWVIITTLFLEYLLLKRIIMLWQSRHSRIFVYKSELCLLTVNAPLNAFIWLTISLLFARCIVNQGLSGMTQIESWEQERIENLFYRKRLIPQLIENLREVFPEGSPMDVEGATELLVNRDVQLIDMVNFPYDRGFIKNLRFFMGPFYTWLIPWSVPTESGFTFQLNDLAMYDSSSPLEDRLMALPWPPDRGFLKLDVETNCSSSNLTVGNTRGETVLKKRLTEFQTDLGRVQWENEWGETLSDFGVDIEAEN
ncbi:LADA_0B10198g1_1 [Lachancea dasiensis]|uniref:Palmitoyltransferase PFA4 n=1 Tax=Lachancea dasiensis TaxID=1072105 RepID=A0A1G4IVL0_9SACH|nr:LADA_0B10198g1_1 [Lachancea dasiensis]